MNIAWYGNTKFHPKDLDERDKVLKDFLQTDLKTSDILMFQEITRPERFVKLLDAKYTCSAYDFRGFAHQYVLTCFDKTKFGQLDFSADLFNPNRKLTISDPSERLRDVLQVSLKTKGTSHIINTYNVHLKAGLDETEKRELQALELIEQLHSQNIPSEETIILGGDFNSYTRNINGNRVSEIDNFLDLSLAKGFNFFTQKDQPTTLAKTQKIFDFLIIKTIKTITDYIIHPVCDNPKNGDNKFYNLDFYKAYISDHCPVSTHLQLN